MRHHSFHNGAARLRHHFRFHAPHAHLSSVFGDDAFAVRAEAFARFFGTPTYLVVQTVIVFVWVVVNLVGITHFDVYPFILLNLGLILRAICEPWRAIAPSPENAAGLLTSAILQVIAGFLIVWVCWPRIRERGGS